MEEESDDALRAKLHDSRIAKEEREQARAILARRGAPAVKPKARRSGAGIGIAVGALVVFFMCAPCLLALVIRIGIAEAYEMDGPSMAPDYAHGDRIVVSKLEYGLFLPFTSEAAISWASPAVGDVVILRSPFDGIDIIKRVVAIPGDTIAIEGDVIVRNGERVERRELGPVDGDPSVRCIEETMEGRSWTVLEHDGLPDDLAEMTVPAGHVFVLGDNRHRSNDSRNPRVGMIPFARLKGRALMHYVRAVERPRCP